MSEWRLGRGWTEAELQRRLEALAAAEHNFDFQPDRMTSDAGWHRVSSEAVIGREAPGPPLDGGSWARARAGVAGFTFSDPRIVVAHFDAASPLLGRRLLLELKALRIVRFLGGALVGAVREERGPPGDPERTEFGFRYETLDGHVERGYEWFLIDKLHATGEIRFRIEAVWRSGQLPTWWSRLGFRWLGPAYQRRWHDRAHSLLARAARGEAAPRPARGLVRSDPRMVFTRTPATGPPPPRRRTMSRSRTYAVAAGLGALSGIRTMGSPALLARRLGGRRSAAILTALAVGEAGADKTPFVPPRTQAPALAARAVSGAICGGVAARGLGRGSVVLAGLLGAAAALAVAPVATRVRRLAAERTRIPDPVLGAAEDAVVVAAGDRLARAGAGE